MDFSLNDVQQSMVNNVRKFATKELLPKYNYWDKNELFPQEQWEKMGELGLLGLRVPTEYGGMETDCFTAGLMAEEVAKGDFSCGYGVLLTGLIGDILARFATESVKKTWMEPMALGEKILCIALTEPHCGSDAAALKAKAVRKGDVYVLNGEKSSISMLLAANAAVVFAKTDPAKGAKGISAFLVPLDSPGVSRFPYDDMGEKAIVRGSLFLEDVEVPVENLIGNEGGGFIQVMQGFDYSRALIGLMCVGAAQVTLNETIEYVKERKAFGKSLSHNQGISFPIVEWQAKVDMARLLCYQTLWLRDHELPHTKEAAMCKWVCPELAAATIHNCLLLHGHYGYTTDFPVEQRLRDVIGLQIGDGTAQIQKMIIARELFGREFVSF